MKKLLTLASLLLIGIGSYAQDNDGMENPWRNNHAGFLPQVAIQAPYAWYGLDSLIIADGEEFLLLLGKQGQFHQQLFQESTIVNSGSYSARLVTVMQDTLGLVPGTLSNAKANVDLAAVIGGADPTTAISYSGGTAVSARITSVNAWVEYYTPGSDEGELAVEAVEMINGIDSVIGTGDVTIDPTSSFTQVSANITYTDPSLVPDTVRIVFLSSGATPVDSSTLYVDDVSMSFEEGVPNTTLKSELVSIAPNPSTGVFYLHSASNANLGLRVFSVSGQTVAKKDLTGNDVIDLSDMSSGVYFYTVSDKNGVAVQNGKVTLIK